MIPWIDPEVSYLGMNDLRKVSREMIDGKTLILMHGTRPLAVVVPYETYIELQGLIELPKAKAAAAGAGR